jgi:2-polyprenyl-3-methyl-5-hydroxy-6-metoxy-1,4-benzoquinol methylase
MKNPGQPTLSLPLHKTLAQKDGRELYGTDPHDYYAVHYRKRIARIIAAAVRLKPKQAVEFGCAQGNIALQLAEQGVPVVAADIDASMLSFCARKYERGSFHPVIASAVAPPLKSGSCDCVILAEILEHCGDPLSMLRPAWDLLKPGGVCIITTPNQESGRNTLPSYSRIVADRGTLSDLTFGPDGDAHIFAFTRRELHDFVRTAGFVIEQSTTMGNHLLQWKYLYHARHAFPWFWNSVLEAVVPFLPVLNRIATHCLFLVCRKK